MSGCDKTGAEPYEELNQLRRRVADLEAAEQSLCDREQRTAYLLQSSPLGIHECDSLGRITYVNPSQTRLTGYTAEELVGTYIWDRMEVGNLKDSMPAYLRHLVSEQPPPISYVVRNLRKDGEPYDLRIDWSYKRDSEGQVVGFVSILTDVTAFKQTEATMRKAQEILEESVRMRTLELTEMNEQLRAEIRSRKETEDALRQSRDALQYEQRTLKHLLQASDHERQLIAYEIHDELAQQLAGATMQFQTFEYMKDRQPKDAAGAFQAGMTMLQQAHFETRRLIAGVRPPILDESGVVAAVGHMVNEQIRRGGPKIEFRSQVDFDRLTPIIENSLYRIGQEALSNACRHSGSNNVRISLQQRDDRVRILIRDWGVGFDPKNVRDGCYGLAGIRQRARLLGGRCKIRSEIGKGACIVAELPVVERE
jgi:PAS domain S-box-containing protein